MRWAGSRHWAAVHRIRLGGMSAVVGLGGGRVGGGRWKKKKGAVAVEMQRR